MVELRDLIDRFDRVVASAEGLVSEDVLVDAASVARRARDRRGFLGDTVVVALAGGTGSGKSSLVNALADEVVTESGAQRPTTYEPMAWIPANPEPGLVRLLDAIGIDLRVGQDRAPWLAVIDLPDTDSVSEDNRATVQRVLPLVDAVVWVVDPEKYQDKVLHQRYLRPLARHAERFVFVLNQIDRLAPGEADDLVEDLRSTLAAEGIVEPTILTTAADPPAGPPQGIDRFLEAMGDLGDAKSIVERRLVADMDDAARTLLAAAGITSAAGTGFSTTWDAALDDAAAAIAGDLLGQSTTVEAGRVGARVARHASSLRGRGEPTPAVAIAPAPGDGTRRAADRIDRMIGDLIDTVGSEHAAPLRDVRAGVEQEVHAAATSTGASLSVRLGERPGWWAVAGWLRLLSALSAAAAGFWIADQQALTAPLPILVAGIAAVVVWTSFAAVIGASGRRWGAAAVTETDADVAASARRELDRRIGRPLRDALRIRASLASAHADFELLRSTFVASGASR